MSNTRPPVVETPGQPRASLPPINFVPLAQALLAMAGTLLPQWLPDGVQHGHEYKCASLQGGKGTSTSINVTTGQWADFATNEQGGDLLGLYAAIHGLTMGKAALQVAQELGLEDVAGVQRLRSPGSAPAPRPTPAPTAAPVPRATDEGWATVAPVPAGVMAATFRHHYRQPADIEHLAEYRVDGDLHGFVVRFRASDGGKDTLPYTWCQSARDGAAKWCWRTWDAPRPLYYPGHTSPGARTVVLVEGEKKADALQALLDAAMPDIYCVASWVGGCNGWKKARWEWLAGCTVLLWPDCDAKHEKLTAAERKATPDKDAQAALQKSKPLLSAEDQPGMAAMLGIGALLHDDHGCSVSMLQIPAPGVVPDGWDCGDAIHADGWDAARVLAFLGTAQALRSVSDAVVADGVATAAAAGKKIDGLIDMEGGDFGDSESLVKIGSRLIPDWMACYYDEDKRRWNTSRKLVILILERDPALCEVLAYNELSHGIQARTPWPWPHGPAGDVTDATDLMLGKYLTDTYGLPSISRAALAEAIQTVAHTRRFHPIREYLQGLQWDGKSRIDKWLVHAIGESPTTLDAAKLEYLQLVGRFLLLGMVNRVMEPGCKFDYCAVFEGVGGLRKSTLVEILGGKEYFSDTPFSLDKGKEAQEQVAGRWVYEIAELSHFSKSEVEAIKGFISSKVDRYRVAYGTTVSSFPRQVVLVGTTNQNTYLRDRTGNRRFWPIPVRNVINTGWVAKYRDQLLAEAFALYGQGAVFNPSDDQEKRLFAPMQQSRLVETAVVSELQAVLTRSPTAAGIGAVINELTQFCTIAQLTLALGVDAAKSTPALEAQIRGWMEHEGWERAKKMVNSVRAWGYVRPANWPAELDQDEMQAAGVQPGAVATDEQDDDDVPF